MSGWSGGNITGDEAAESRAERPCTCRSSSRLQPTKATRWPVPLLLALFAFALLELVRAVWRLRPARYRNMIRGTAPSAYGYGASCKADGVARGWRFSALG
jgi:hypothetical protein